MGRREGSAETCFCVSCAEGESGTHNCSTAYYMESSRKAVKQEFWRGGTQNW